MLVSSSIIFPLAIIIIVLFAIPENVRALPTPAVLSPNPYWGPSALQGQPEDTSIRTFQITIDEQILVDLRTRLALETSTTDNRFILPIENAGFEHGSNSDYLKTVAKYWLESYDWKTREKLLNIYPHFKTKIYGLNLHFQHVKSGGGGNKAPPVPLLLLHGWPGSIVEFQKMIPLLVNSNINFELVIPSLPGFGFSDAASQEGMGSVEVAQIMNALMERLGYPEYYVQGGDWGSHIATNMGVFYPENVRALHLNTCWTPNFKSWIRYALGAALPKFTKESKVGYPISKWFPLALQETGYFHEQVTKPDTIGIALSNSPSGLASYILEKFSTHTNNEWINRKDGGLTNFNLDELLDNIMIAWVTNSITGPLRLYRETFGPKLLRNLAFENSPVQVPTACYQPPNEKIFSLPKWALQEKYKQLVRYNIGAKGGHFTAFEEPNELADDVIDFVKSLEHHEML